MLVIFLSSLAHKTLLLLKHLTFKIKLSIAINCCKVYCYHHIYHYLMTSHFLMLALNLYVLFSSVILLSCSIYRCCNNIKHFYITTSEHWELGHYINYKLSVSWRKYHVKLDYTTSGVLEHKWRTSLKLHYC